MNRTMCYSINEGTIQHYLHEVIRQNYEATKTYTLPKEVFTERLEHLRNLTDIRGKPYPFFAGLVLWSINNGHVVDEKYLISAYEILSEKLIAESVGLATEPADNDFFKATRETRLFRVEVLKEELGIIKYVMESQLPYPEKMTVSLSKSVENQARINELHGQLLNFAVEHQVRIVLQRQPTRDNLTPEPREISFTVEKNRETNE